MSRLWARVAVCVALSLVFVGLTGSTSSAAATKTPVMGKSSMTAKQLAAWYQRHHGTAQPRIPVLHNDVEKLAQMFLDVGAHEGVRGDIAFVQAIVETNWLSFVGSHVPADAYNYAGVYAFNDRAALKTCAHGDAKPSRCMGSPRQGVLVQIQLLRSYADPKTKKLKDRLIAAPSDRIGAAPLWEYFGGDNCPCHKLIWATAHDYGKLVVAIYDQAVNEGRPKPAKPPAEPVLKVGSKGEPVTRLQGDLNRLRNAHLSADGLFGPKTERAVEDFQRASRLSVDGVVGPHTWAALDHGVAGKR